MKKYICIIVMLIPLFMTSCSNTNKERFVYNENSIYDIYFNHVGNIGFIQVGDIKKGNINYGKLKYIPTKDDNKMVSRLVNSADNKVYASVRTPGSKNANRLIVLKNGEIQKEIVFKDNHKPGELINDIENNRVFVELTQSNAINQPLGTPVRIVNYETDEYYDCPFYIKGGLYGSGIFGDYIYGISEGASECLYNDVPNNYIFKINRNSLIMEIIDNDDIGYIARDFEVSPNGKIYITSNGEIKMTDQNNPEKSKYISDDNLWIYNLKGKFIKKVKLKPWCDKIIIDKKGTAYISHIGKDFDSDYLGETLTIYDTNTDKVIKTVDGLNGITSMFLQDNYLFIYESQKQCIAVMDINNFDIIGEIPIDYKGFCLSMVVVKNNK